MNKQSSSYTFYPTDKENKKNEPVILIHGLMRTSGSMKHLGLHLNKAGYDVYLYRYNSTQYFINELSLQFKIFLTTLSTKKEVDHGFNIISHSLGGIIAREALSKLDSALNIQCNKLIMLAPPNKGSDFAKLTLKVLPFLATWIKPLSQLSSCPTAYVHQVAIPKSVLIGTIAGKYDTKTPPATTHLPNQTDFICVSSAHTFIMNNQQTKRAIINFLESGRF